MRPDPMWFFCKDAGGLLEGPLGRFFRRWNVRSSRQYIIASKLPLDEGGDSADPASRRESYVSSLLPAPGVKTLVLYDVHFQSPREGLSAFREVRREPWYLSGGAIEELEENVEARLSKARALGRLIRQEREPIVVAGDLNSPDASLACATLRQAGLHDAFAQAGKGYGYTYGHFLLRRRLPWLAVPWVRIDHVMLSGYLTSRACWAGTEDLSDHRPVIADIAL